ncbi:MAG TPA: MFS transporter, partial [Polyangiales bacterium]|nr:MFS transporter [Polyangiales bacterium]
MTRFQTVAVLICMVLNLIDGFDVLAIAFAAPLLSKDWQLPPAELGVLLSAGLAGMTAGSLLVAPLADRWGRRFLTLLSLAVVSVGMLASAFVEDSFQMAITRLLTGLGVGAMLPSLNTIVAEYASARRRELALSIMSTGYPIGATLGGIAAILIIDSFGWRGIFVLGGTLSTLMIPLVMWRLPESLDFLLTRRPANALGSANALLRKLGQPELDALPERTAATRGARVQDIFAGTLATRTWLLWLAFFCVMSSFYFVLSWTPKLLVDAGLTPGRGLSGGVLVNLGGIAGTVLLGVLAARLGIFRLHACAILAAAAAVSAFGLASGSLQVAFALAPVVGLFLFISLVGLYVITPTIYPTEVRNTGTGFAIGVGRCAGIASPYLAGLLLAAGWSPGRAY